MSVHPGRTRRRRELSQHFLRGGATATELLGCTSISSRDLVLEIGPGRGAFTRPLVERCERLIAVELDGDLCRQLQDELGDRAEIVGGDFLAYALPTEPYKVIGSVPYSRTTEIVRCLTAAQPAPSDAWLVVQREAARRFAGSPWGRETRWSLRLGPWWHREILRTLRRSDFDPPPSVDSVWLWLARRDRSLVAPGEARRYRALTDELFASGSALGPFLRRRLSRTQMARLSRDLHFDPAGPPSCLRFEQWLPLYRFLARERALR